MSDPAFVTALVDRLLFGLVNAQVYGPTHARVHQAAELAAERVASHCRNADAPRVLVGAVGDRIVHEGRPILGASLFAKRLIQRIQERGSGGVEFEATASSDDIAAFFEVLGRRGGAADHESANRELQAKGVLRVRFVPTYGVAAGGASQGGIAEAGALVTLHQDMVDLLQGLTVSVCQGREMDMGRVGHTVEHVISGLERDAGVMHGLAHYPDYDFFTFGHSIRVGLLAIDVARATTDDTVLLHRIGTAALLHDVGKALIPWEILHKRGPLTVDERREMQRHPVLGAGVLLENRESDALSVAAAYGHHCQVNGQGYPRTLGEFDQSIVTRLVKICDVYEALTATRPYKRAMTPAKAYRVMFDMPGHFDPDLLRHFIRTVGIYPAGTRVRLDTGDIARVIRQTGDFHRPLIEIVEHDGGPVAEDDVTPYDLTAPEVGGAMKIEAALPMVSDSVALV